MMDVKVSKDKDINEWVYQENLIYVRWNTIKNCLTMKKVINSGKRSKALSEVKLVKNISKNPKSFLEIKEKEVLLSHKLQDHAYE